MRNYPVILKRSCIILSFLLIISLYDLHSQASIITERLRSDRTGQNINEPEITGYLNSLNHDGSWPDIDYSNTSRTNWQPVTHSRRLVQICIAYNKPGNILYHKAEVRQKIIKILDYYILVKPVSDNWWYNAIGAPTNFGPALVLMKTGDEFGFDQATLDRYADILLYYFSESAKKWPSATTGANKIWLLNSSIHKACIKNNEPVLAENFVSAFEEAAIMPGRAEGIKNDQSFWQHGPQLYTSGYGMSFLMDITWFGSLAAGTDYAMSSMQVKVLTDVVLQGYRWLCQKTAFDFGSSGREISRPGAMSTSSLKTAVNRLITINGPGKKELESFLDWLNGKTDFSNPGNRHFWRSDIMVQHGSDFYISARIPSKRIYATERMNEENLKRKWLPWGATNIMIDGDEYRNIFPAWDWSRIPGVTSVHENVPGLPIIGGAYLSSSTDFAGGASDGICGMAAYDITWDGVSARKAYFFTPEALYCLGSGINAERNNNIITSVNQCYSTGSVKMKRNGLVSESHEEEIISDDIAWIHHDRIGYYFPKGGALTFKNTDQTGRWKDINTSQSDALVTNKVFSIWFNHGINPSDKMYEYCVVPAISESRFEKWTGSMQLRSVENSKKIQAVYDGSIDTYGIVFYEPGSINPEAGLMVTVDHPCILLLNREKYVGKYRISVSDPTALLGKIKITISKNLNGVYVTGKSGNNSEVEIDLPSGDEAGKTVIMEFTSETGSFPEGDTEAIAWPNPSSGGFYLSEINNISRVNVFNSNGSHLCRYESPVEGMIGEEWKSGLYLLNVEYETKETKSQKLIKTR